MAVFDRQPADVATSAGENRQADALDGALADLLALGLLAKQAQWNVVGPSFRAAHHLFDEIAEIARDSADRVAERAVVLGHSPDGRAATIVERSALPSVEAGVLHDAAAIAAFIPILDAMIDRIRSVLEAFEKDVVTASLFTGVGATVERSAWLLRSTVQAP